MSRPPALRAAAWKASTSPTADAAYWAGPLLNNLGWHYYEAGEYAQALEVFERALEVRKRDPDNPQAITWAEEAVAEARKALTS